MKLILLKSSLLVFLIISSFSTVTDHESGYPIAKEMFEKTAAIQSLTYTITKQERIDGELVKQVSFTKMEKKPYKVYLKQKYPNDGMEVLYVEGSNHDKAIINPNGFPWINLKLDPNDGIMRNDQHHTIFQSGFDYVVSILDFLCVKYQNEIGKMVKYDGVVTWEGRECHLLSFVNPYFEYIDYTMLEGEDIEDVANKYMLSAYMILEQNKNIKDYEDVEAGQVIVIPNDYSPKMVLYIDTVEMIPLRMDIYDDKELYEKYVYSNVEINPVLTAEDFSQDSPAYGF